MATPQDELAIIGETPGLWVPECDEIHVSCSFTYDIPQAEQLAEAWRAVGVPVILGGPAYGDPGGDFVPGRYLKPGWTITSRGCINHCWFCYVAKREGALRELPIHGGYILQDNNLLACSRQHVAAVFDMLQRQPQRAEFRGGIDPKLVEDWHCERFKTLHPKIVYTAYDTDDDLEPVVEMARKLWRAGNTPVSQIYRCYILYAYPKDTPERATERIRRVISLGFRPYPMFYQSDKYRTTPHDWTPFRQVWNNAIMATGKMLTQWNSERCEWHNWCDKSILKTLTDLPAVEE
jgi:hypothetical protein